MFEVHARRLDDGGPVKQAATASIAHQHCGELLSAGWPSLLIHHRSGTTGDLEDLEWLLNSIG